MENTIGIYICEGCRIGQAMDVGSFTSKMAEELKPAFCRSHKALCSGDGTACLVRALAEDSLSGILIAGCGAGTKDKEFQLGETVVVERVNIRELVAWSMEPGAEDTIAAAADYIRMGFAGLSHQAKVVPYLRENVSREILVVGGGITGLQAAFLGAENGYHVHLVESTLNLGGWAARWNKQIPFDRYSNELAEPLVHKLVDKVIAHDLITVHLNTSVDSIGGEPGGFEVKVRGEKNVIKVGAIVSATGWKPYRPESTSFYGLGEVPGVITSVDLEEQLGNGVLEPAESIMFVQCAGSRDSQHLPYCSSVCCGVTLKQVKVIREQHPDTLIYVLYKDIRTPGFLEDFYKEVQADPLTIFIKGNINSVSGDGKKVAVSIQDHLLGETLEAEVESVVLATGMVPRGSSGLNLSYRMGKEVPGHRYEFPDSHFICFPYETRRTGIYTAGGLRAPMDIPSAMEDGSGAMMKAIQAIEATARGEAVHPRSGDQSYPELYLERCTDCKRCTEECPFGTYDETPSGTPVVNPSRCRRCGICLGACPERVISFADYSIRIISEKIKSVEVPDEFEEKPRVLVFMCENDALPALQMAVRKELKLNPYVRIIPVRCLGSVNRIWISDALSRGYDGILQIGCKPGDDYQCHFIHGSELTGQRSEIFEETLSSMMLEPERVRTRFVEITDYNGIIKHIDEYMDEIDLIGPNPFKEL